MNVGKRNYSRVPGAQSRKAIEPLTISVKFPVASRATVKPIATAIPMYVIDVIIIAKMVPFGMDDEGSCKVKKVWFKSKLSPKKAIIVHLQISRNIGSSQNTSCGWEENGQHGEEIVLHAIVWSVIRPEIALKYRG